MAMLVLASTARATSRTGFVTKMYTNPDGSKSSYVVFVPHHYNKRTSPVAVMLFLHGAGEAQGGATQPVDVGLGPYIKRHAQSFPFLVVFPQAQRRDPNLAETWWPVKKEGDRALAILADVQKHYSVDPNRLYLTGVSMGGYGTWRLALEQPGLFAALVPVCGGLDAPPQLAPRGAATSEVLRAAAAALRNTPAWVFHGDADPIIPVEESRVMVDALRRAGADVRYTEYGGVEHNSWDAAYAEPELWAWLLGQRRR
jgi:predicted peptidase